MDVLLRGIQICDPNSPFHGQRKDLLIRNGIVEKIGNSLKKPQGVSEKKFDDAYISPGWVDLTAKSGEPGFEHKEDLDTLSDSGVRGGFTIIGCLPDTDPALDSKSHLEFVIKKTSPKLCRIYPVGAVTKNCSGEKLTDINDLHNSGAIGFSNGWIKPLNSGVTEKILFYLKSFNGLYISFPDTPSMSEETIMHQGKVSTSLGLFGMPSVSEEMAVIRDLKLLEFTDSKLHFGAISAAESIEQIDAAKKKKLNVSAAVPVFNLLYTDKILELYDSMYKVKPPFREESDRKKLKTALKKGIIDCVTALHIPEDEDAKNRELDDAAYGMQGLETVFSALLMAFENQLEAEDVVQWLSVRPRKVAGLPIPVVDEKQAAEFTVFSPGKKWVYKQQDKLSKSSNNPLLGKELNGFVEGVITERGSKWF